MNKVLIIIIVILIGGNAILLQDSNKIKRINHGLTIKLNETRNEVDKKDKVIYDMREHITNIELNLEMYKLGYNRACNKLLKVTNNTTGIIDLN